jgi:hypothetical protein
MCECVGRGVQATFCPRIIKPARQKCGLLRSPFLSIFKLKMADDNTSTESKTKQRWVPLEANPDVSLYTI